MDISQILGWAATFLFSVMLIPQIIKTIKLKNTEGVSISLFVIYLIANLIAISYAIMIGQYPLIIKYNLAILTTIFYLTIFIFLKKRKNGQKI